VRSPTYGDEFKWWLLAIRNSDRGRFGSAFAADEVTTIRQPGLLAFADLPGYQTSVIAADYGGTIFRGSYLYPRAACGLRS
jgi:hypothetical protein